MRTTRILTILILTLGVMVWAANLSEAALVGTAFTYQGRLIDANHAADGEYDFQFGLYDDPCSGSQLGSDVNKPDVDVIDGYFTVQLDFGSGPNTFNGDAHWLEIGVRPGDQNDPNTYRPLTPRQKLTPTPYALALPGLRVQQHSTSPNILGGYKGNIITPGVYGAVIAGGGKEGSLYLHKVTDEFCTVGGGVHNQAGDDSPGTNTARCATVAGGASNTASNYYATIGGGGGNIADSWYSTVSGGQQNEATGDSWSTVGGGILNEAGAVGATIAGGWLNDALGDCAIVSGGKGNIADKNYASVSGGQNNTASGTLATVGGGENNSASAWAATVSGGQQNQASSGSATVGGGANNTASGSSATVPGGHSNTAQGNYSFAAGRRAKANHQGTFVWADSADANFASTDPNQFLIRASGGVGIGTDSPAEQLHIGGSVKADGDIKVSETVVSSGTPISSEQSTSSTAFVQLTQFDLPDQNADRLVTLNVRFHAKGQSAGQTAVFIVRGFCYGDGSAVDLADHYGSAPLLGAIHIRNASYNNYHLNLGPFAMSDDQKWKIVIFYRTRNGSYPAYIDELEWQARSIRYEY